MFFLSPLTSQEAVVGQWLARPIRIGRSQVRFLPTVLVVFFLPQLLLMFFVDCQTVSDAATCQQIIATGFINSLLHRNNATKNQHHHPDYNSIQQNENKKKCLFLFLAPSVVRL
ncbi:hypothetical protein KCU99_g382, partial [Aureobasidium melanogenum]